MKKNEFVSVYDFQKDAYEKFKGIYDRLNFVHCCIDITLFLLLVIFVVLYFFLSNKFVNCFLPIIIPFIFGGYLFFKNSFFSSLYANKIKIVPSNMNLKSIFVAECYNVFSFEEIDYAIDYATQKLNYKKYSSVIIPVIAVMFVGIFQSLCSDMFSIICENISSTEEQISWFTAFVEIGNSNIMFFLFIFVLIYVLCNFVYKYLIYCEQELIDLLQYLKTCCKRNDIRK